MNQEGVWLSILDYANAKKISISTIRRSIKADQVKFKEEHGKYFIWMSGTESHKEELAMKMEIEFLKKVNRELKEELNDLKMLLQVYESNAMTEIFPPLPPVER